MMKTFVFAATSIAYILFVASIADAKVQKSDKKIDREQACINQTIAIAKQPKSLQPAVVSTADIRGICQAISEEYKELNNTIRNLPIADKSFTPWKDFIEVEKITLTSFEVGKSYDGERKYTHIEIAEIVRHYRSKSMKKLPNGGLVSANSVTIDSYNWEQNPDKEEMTRRNRRTCVHKLQGKWSVTTYNCTIDDKK